MIGDDRLDATFAALANPVRRDILVRLRGGGVPVTGLAQSYRLSLPSISRHLDVLEHAGLVTRTADGRTRICALAPGAVDPALRWLSEHRRFWTSTLDSLAAHLERQAQGDVGRVQPGPRTTRKGPKRG